MGNQDLKSRRSEGLGRRRWSDCVVAWEGQGWVEQGKLLKKNKGENPSDTAQIQGQTRKKSGAGSNTDTEAQGQGLMGERKNGRKKEGGEV